MNQLIDNVVEKLFGYKVDETLSIKECAYNEYLKKDYNVFKELDFELWIKTNPDLMKKIEETVKER